MKQVEAELKLQSRKSLSLPPTTNTSKLQLHVEQLSLSIIWKLEEYLCYEKGYKERTAAAKSLQTCPTLCDPIDDSLPGSPVPGILQARTLERVAISFSNASKWKVKVVSQSCLTLRDPMDCSPPGSSIHGIFQARVPEWGAITFSNWSIADSKFFLSSVIYM